jgi:hypothetical protein
MTKYKKAPEKSVPRVTRDILLSWEAFKRMFPGIAAVLIYTDGFTNTKWAEELIKTELWPDNPSSQDLEFIEYIRKGGEVRQFGEADYFKTHDFPCVSRWVDEMVKLNGITGKPRVRYENLGLTCPQLTVMFTRGLTDPGMSRHREQDTTYCEMRDLPPELQLKMAIYGDVY